MVHFNDNDSCYPPSTSPDETDSYLPLWRQASGNLEGVDLQSTPTLTNGWSMVSQPGSSAIPSTSFPLTSYGKKSSSIFIDPRLTHSSLESRFPMLGSYPDPSQASYWPTISQTTQDCPGMLSWENPFASSYGWETVMPTLTPNPGEYHLAKVRDSNAHQSLTVQTDFWSSRQYPAPNDASYAVSTRGPLSPMIVNGLL